MCTITINVDESLLRGLDPDLSTESAIRSWAQSLIDCRIEEMMDMNEEVMDLETARERLHEMIKKEYASV